MASDFTVIQAVRQRFGIGPAQRFPFELQAPAVGLSKDYAFSCSHVDSSQMAVLQFESLGVSAGRYYQDRDILRINGVDIPGGITAGPHQTEFTEGERIWKSNTLLVPENVLREQNVLHIECIPIFVMGDIIAFDQFMVDNVVVFFKTQRTLGGGLTNPNPGVAGSKPTTTPKARTKNKPIMKRRLEQ
jgi:hypothetical protein